MLAKNKEMPERKEEVAEYELQDLLGVGMTFVVLTIGLAFGADITGDIGDDMENDSLEKNITDDGLTAVGKLSTKLGTIATVVIASIIIGILVRFLWMKFAA